MMRQRLGLVVAVLVVLLGLLAACVGKAEPEVSPAGADYTTACYRSVGGDAWVCGSGGSMTFQSGSTLSVESGTTFSTAADLAATGAVNVGGGFGSTGCTISTAGALQCDGAATLGSTLAVTGTISGSLSGDATLDDLVLTAGTSVTVTEGAAFAISAAWQPVTAAGAVTPTITIPAAGVAFCVVNNSAQVVTIADTGNQVFTADAVLGQYDVLCAVSDGTRVIETSRANN